jgi:hypothetical protein
MKIPIFCVLCVLFSGFWPATINAGSLPAPTTPTILNPEGEDSESIPAPAPPLLNPGKTKDGSVDVVGYLREFEYLTDTQTNLHKALRQLQREKYLRVTGSITAETIYFVEEEIKQNNAILYLRKCKFLEGIESPRNIRMAILKLQETVQLVQTGTFTEATLDFVEQTNECFNK